VTAGSVPHNPDGRESRVSPTTWSLIRRLLALGWSYRSACVGVVLLHVFLVALNLGGLGFTGLGIDFIRSQLDASRGAPQWPLGIEPPADWSPITTVAAIGVAVLLVALLHMALKYVTALAVAGLTQRVLVRLRGDVYDKLQRLSFRFFDAHASSSIINRTAGDVQAVRTFVDGVIVKVLSVLLTLTVYTSYMVQVHAPLTLACLATSPLLWVGAVWFSRAVQPRYRRASELGDDLVLTLVESVQGIQVVKGFARESDQVARFRAANERLRDQKHSIFWTISTFQPAMGFLTQLNMLVLIGCGGYLVIRGEMPLGAGLFVFANLLHEFANQVGQITNVANTIQSSLVGAERVFEVLDAPSEIASPPDAVRLVRSRGGIRFDRVSFAYKPGEPVLADVTIDVAPGECVGIVGETGAGKSTLLSLIGRFYDVTTGSVSIDDVDTRRLDLADLRRQLGVVFQDSFLFSNTVAANIAFGRHDATSGEVEHAARLAAAHDFIGRLAAGYETLIGEHGSNLSGGQRQRLALARALLLDPPILLLDDATAAVDPETEHEIGRAVAGAMRGRTTLVVSNRISTLRRADRIVVLNRGRVAQQGTHDELMQSSSYYRRLAELQASGWPDPPTEPADKPAASPLARSVA
jgi:ATP-binding cassette subfamily B protein